MAKKQRRNTKGKIVSAAWSLFYKQGYDDTTIDEIIEESGTSRGSFYHYFEGKDALLSTLSTLFDDKYEELSEDLDPGMHAFDKLMFLNAELFDMIENQISVTLLAKMLGTQLTTRAEKHLLDKNRYYFKMLDTIISEGLEKGELKFDCPVSDVVKAYAMCERALLYDWCINDGEYSLSAYSKMMLPRMFCSYDSRR